MIENIHENHGWDVYEVEDLLDNVAKAARNIEGVIFNMKKIHFILHILFCVLFYSEAYAKRFFFKFKFFSSSSRSSSYSSYRSTSNK